MKIEAYFYNDPSVGIPSSCHEFDFGDTDPFEGYADADVAREDARKAFYAFVMTFEDSEPSYVMFDDELEALTKGVDHV